MKKADDFIKDYYVDKQGRKYSDPEMTIASKQHIESKIEELIPLLKVVQEDAIRETVKECVTLSKLKYYAGESGYLDKENIEILADKLIKEL